MNDHSVAQGKKAMVPIELENDYQLQEAQISVSRET